MYSKEELELEKRGVWVSLELDRAHRLAYAGCAPGPKDSRDRNQFFDYMRAKKLRKRCGQ